MRQLFSFFLLLLILLNTFGYYEVLTLIEDEQFNSFVSKIDGKENEISGNLLLRIPLAVPYGHDDDEYQKANGEIFLGGELYHFVKRKMYHDTLYIVCLKDVSTTKARAAVSEYSKSFTDELPKSGAAKIKTNSSLSLFYVLSQNLTTDFQSERVLKMENEFFLNLYRFTSVSAIFHPPSF